MAIPGKLIGHEGDSSSGTMARSQEVLGLISTLADRKQQDLDFLRSVLKEKRGKANGNSISRPQLSVAPITGEKKASTALQELPKKKPTAGWNCARCIFLDFPLALLFFSLAVSYFMRTIYNTYYVPIMESARRSDDDLEEEFTYYRRACTVQDFTTDDFMSGTLPNTTSESVDFIMRHGATVFPDLLTAQTIEKLQRFIAHKSQRIKAEEIYPMSQGHHRLSYGIEATEDKAVVQALKEITSHKVLTDSLIQILGTTDPALTEITQITAYYGCADQVIHSDTKAEGSGGYAGTNARTYSHSYSLFIPVVNVTEMMGVTQICPGTHYCANDLTEVCGEHKLGVNDLFSDKIWHAGTGTLINQQVWHGGSSNKDPYAQARILFIVSFIAPPRLGHDPRQLARGTYFHMKWNMWGHTWRDIALDSAITTSWPFNVLRSMAIWKPRNRNWGYDLLLGAALRAANNQQGMEAEDLETFIDLKMNKLLHYPRWLQGTFSYSENAWQVYLKETFDNTFAFMKLLNLVVHPFYLLVALIVAQRSSSTVGFRSTLWRMLISHGIIVCLFSKLLWNVRHSDWGSNILLGRTFVRPFAVDEDITSFRWETDPSIPAAATTLPERMDILFGSRFDAKYLGSYNRWLEYHPGNVVFRRVVSERAFLYQALSSMGQPVFVQRFVGDVVELVKNETISGRFLQQDHTTGNWAPISKLEVFKLTMLALVTESNRLAKALNQEINFLVADYRFGHLRGSAMAVDSTFFLDQLRKRLFGCYESLLIDPHALLRLTEDGDTWETQRLFRPVNRDALAVKRTVNPLQSRTTNGEKINAGTAVMCYFSMTSSWLKGTVEAVKSGAYDVVFEDGTFEENVSIRRIRQPIHLEEGVRVNVFMENVITAFEATVVAVYPSGKVDLAFDDGDFFRDVEEGQYEIIYPSF